MSVYHCDGCGRLTDGDFDGCTEGRTGKEDCICDACVEEYCCMICGDYSPDVLYDENEGSYYHDECFKKESGFL